MRIWPVFLLTASMGLWGCRSDDAPRVLSAELLDNKNPDGTAGAGETIRITLDRPLPAGAGMDQIRLWSSPPLTRLLIRAHPQPDPSVIDIELLSTPPPLAAEGTFRGDPSAERGPSGIGVDLGPAALGEQWVDFQIRRTFPILERAVWEDRKPPGAPGGNLTVDQGDWIRLVFDSEVRIAASDSQEGTENPSCPALVPGDLILPIEEDRLDDGAVPSFFEEGTNSREVRIVLGSNPRLTIAGRHRPPSSGMDQAHPFEYLPSGIAVNGTPVLPMMKIVDRRGWPGVICSQPVDIEFPPDYFFFERRAHESFPPPGHRTDHTVVDLFTGGPAVLAGGRTWDGKPTSQVLLYTPEAPSPIVPVGELSEPCYLHTANALPGPDNAANTMDDFVVIAGGTDGNQSLNLLSAVRLDPSSPNQVLVETIDSRLLVPRMYHSATSIPPNILLIDGGRYSAPRGGGGIVVNAEILSFDFQGEKIVLSGLWEFQTLARMHHTSTYLGRDADGAHYILHYGGFGIPPDRELDPAVPYFNPDEGVVLAAPELLRIETKTNGQPSWKRIPLTEKKNYKWSYQMLRYGHRAAPVGFDPLTVQDNRPREVLIVGGSLHPPNFDPDRPGRKLFQLPREGQNVGPFIAPPLYTESAEALIFRFQPASPSESTFQVLESPTGDQRIHFSLAPLDYPGILILGGENPQRPDETYITAEVYLSRERRLAPLAIPLAGSRSRLGTLVVPTPKGASVYVLGGTSSPESAGYLADIELLQINWP